jgi:hypothetical protein
MTITNQQLDQLDPRRIDSYLRSHGWRVQHIRDDGMVYYHCDLLGCWRCEDRGVVWLKPTATLNRRRYHYRYILRILTGLDEGPIYAQERTPESFYEELLTYPIIP